MDVILEKLGDPNLSQYIGSISKGDRKKLGEIQKALPQYDISFLWLLGYRDNRAQEVTDYIEKNYEKFAQILDSKIIKKLCSKGNFKSHMWEMVLCDVLSSSGKLKPKGKDGADFILVVPSGQEIQIEAVVPNESKDPALQSIKPSFDEDNMAELSGNSEDLERPISLRVFNSINNKSQKYDRDKPLILAINSEKTVGFISRDNYILRRLLFGLGNETITRKPDGSFIHGLEQNSTLSKPGQKKFPVGAFRTPKYSQISGIIYTSQNPIGLIPGGFGWSNYGITYVPNPFARHPADIDLPFFRKIFCNDKQYSEKENDLNR